MLLNTGAEAVPSTHGLLTTVGYRLGADAPPCYALEGSVAIAGQGISWLRDRMGFISSAADSEAVAGTVPDTGGVYFVPAFGGLLAPWWRDDARGVIVGLTQYTSKVLHLVLWVLHSPRGGGTACASVAGVEGQAGQAGAPSRGRAPRPSHAPVRPAASPVLPSPSCLIRRLTSCERCWRLSASRLATCCWP